ncbi:hypothetical protein A2U01_0112926, partial [Trifolium medium]|nr:hypothetical protein [Trifolium medium]
MNINQQFLKPQEFGQLKRKEESSYLRDEASCNVYGFTSFEMDENGEGMKFL